MPRRREPEEVPSPEEILGRVRDAMRVEQVFGQPLDEGWRDGHPGRPGDGWRRWRRGDRPGLRRDRRQIDAEHVRIFANVTPEFASPLGERSVAQRARSAVVSSIVDAILIAGPMAGAEPDIAWLQQARQAVGDSVPVLLNTGARVDNIRSFLQV